MFLFCKLADYGKKKDKKQCLYLRKRLIIFLSVQVMGRSVSAGFLQILSRVTDELNKLKRGKMHCFITLAAYLTPVCHAPSALCDLQIN